MPPRIIWPSSHPGHLDNSSTFSSVKGFGDRLLTLLTYRVISNIVQPFNIPIDGRPWPTNCLALPSHAGRTLPGHPNERRGCMDIQPEWLGATTELSAARRGDRGLRRGGRGIRGWRRPSSEGANSNLGLLAAETLDRSTAPSSRSPDWIAALLGPRCAPCEQSPRPLLSPRSERSDSPAVRDGSVPVPALLLELSHR